MRVTFHGVRGSTPCHGRGDRPLRRQHVVCRPSRFPARIPCCSISAPGCATSARRSSPTSRSPRHLPAQPSPLGPHPGAAVLQAAPARRCRRARSMRRRRRVTSRSSRCFADTIKPPLFPIHFSMLPGMIKFHEVWDDEFTIGGDVVTHRGDVPSDPARRQHGRLPGEWRRHVGRLHERSSDAGRRLVRRRHKVRSSCAGRRSADPRRAVHAAEFADKRDWGHCTRRVRRVARRRVRRRSAGAVPSRSGPRRRHHRTILGAAIECAAKMGVEVFAAREGLVVDV